MAPERRLQVGACQILLLGTVAGFVPDAERVRAAFVEFRPDLVALGVPPEDITSLGALAERPDQAARLDPLDEVDERFQHLLSRFGSVRIPSPELETAFGAARTAGAPLVALDMDDPTHSQAYVDRVKVRHLVAAKALRRKAMGSTFAAATDAYQLAIQWEEALATKPTRDLEGLRERHMADQLRAAAAAGPTAPHRILAIVAAARLAGILAHLAG